MKATIINSTSELDKALKAGKLKLSANNMPLVLNQIEESDKEQFDATVKIDGFLYAIEEATEGDTVDSQTMKGEYILN